MTAHEEPHTTDVAGLEIRDLSLKIAGTVLLEQTSFRIEKGELVILVGPSGTGKSLLLQVISGVLSPSASPLEMNGEILVAGHDLMKGGSPRRKAARGVGLVFQDHALFDDMSPRDNLRFALDHRAQRLSSKGKDSLESSLLSEFGLQDLPRIRAMSGGQRQRLAVARTLAQAPELVIYDEPTTGLDPENALRVAEIILRTHQEHNSTSLIVTHDYPSLLPIADRVLLLDPRTRSITPLESKSVAKTMRDIVRETLEPKKHSRSPVPLALIKNAAEKTTDVTAAILSWMIHLIPTFPKFLWGLRFFWHQFRLVGFVSSLLYIAIAGLILGFVATHFTLRYLPYAKFTEPLLIDEILAGLGYLKFRVLSPVLATILIAARCGAAVSADIGNRTYSRQLDAMKSFGIQPSRYFFTSVNYAFLLGAPLLAATMFFVSRWVSQAVFVFEYPEYSAFFWDSNYHKLLGLDTPFYAGWGWVLAKIEIAAAGIGVIAYHQGARPKLSGADVSRAVTSTIIWATLWVLIVQFVMAFFEF